MNISSDANYLRYELSKIALRIRRNRLEVHSLSRPFSSIDYEFSERGFVYKRKKIILAGPGCTAATCTMCPIPNEALYGLKEYFTPEVFIDQFNKAFETETLDTYQLISVYNSGNWFVNREIPATTRRYIYQAVAKSACEGIMVESLPQFVTPQAISEAKEYLGKKRLIVGIGLQSKDDFIRNICINTTCTREQFERASGLLWSNGYTPKVYLMIKPPFLNEREAVVETIQSVQYVASLGYEDVSLCPTRIAPYTVVAELARCGMYIQPSLWTVVDILNGLDTACQARVACLDLDGKDDDTIYPRTCPQCTDSIFNALKYFNTTHNLSLLNEIVCSCKERHKRDMEIIDERSLLMRVRAFLNDYNLKHTRRMAT